jgi:4-hydroxy-tetrahydrodipicolinate synthase
MMDVLNRRPAGFTVYCGDDNLTLPLMVLGGDGVISVASNIVPRQVADMVQCALQGKWDEARKYHYLLLPLLKALFIETNPIPIKTALAMMGMVNEVFRSPLCTMDVQNREKLKVVLESQKIL